MVGYDSLTFKVKNSNNDNNNNNNNNNGILLFTITACCIFTNITMYMSSNAFKLLRNSNTFTEGRFQKFWTRSDSRPRHFFWVVYLVFNVGFVSFRIRVRVGFFGSFRVRPVRAGVRVTFRLGPGT